MKTIRESPLAMYIFTTEPEIQNLFIHSTRSGGMLLNDTIMHYAVDTLPFGGVGFSGMGSYHGKYTFDTFVHRKSCLGKNMRALGEKLSSGRYPPYSERKASILNFLLRKRRPLPNLYLSHILVFGLGIGLTFLVNHYMQSDNK